MISSSSAHARMRASFLPINESATRMRVSDAPSAKSTS